LKKGLVIGVVILFICSVLLPCITVYMKEIRELSSREYASEKRMEGKNTDESLFPKVPGTACI
jgi:hypothetical protein